MACQMFLTSVLLLTDAGGAGTSTATDASPTASSIASDDLGVSPTDASDIGA